MHKRNFNQIQLLLFIISCLFTMNVQSQTYTHEQFGLIEHLPHDSIAYGGSSVKFPISINKLSNADSKHIMGIETLGFGKVNRSTNGGTSWEVVFLDTTRFYSNFIEKRFISISYPVPSMAIIVGDSGMILKTVDMGKTWSEKKYSDTTFFFDLVQMKDSSTGYISGLYRNKSVSSTVFSMRLLKTVDAGETWTPIALPDNLPPESSISDIQYIGESGITLYIASFGRTAGWLLISPDMGKNWTLKPVTMIPQEKYIDMWSITIDKQGVLWGGGFEKVDPNNNSSYVTQILRSTDDGKTWEYMLNTLGVRYERVTKVRFMNSTHGVASTSGYSLIYTIDGGNTWKIDTSAITKYKSVFGFSYNNAICLDTNTIIATCQARAGTIKATRQKTSSVVDEHDKSYGEIQNITQEMHMIDVSAFRGNVQVSLFDDMGRLLQSQSEYVYPSQNKEITLNLHNLSSGVYYYTIKDDSKMVSNRILRVK